MLAHARQCPFFDELQQLHKTQGKGVHLTRASASRRIRRQVSSGSVFIQHKYLESTVTRKQGNPDWTGEKPPLAPASPSTEFELQARRLGLAEGDYASSDQLRGWCAQNRDRCYVPEWLLKTWGMTTDPSVV
jgi:hypothetical protein